MELPGSQHLSEAVIATGSTIAIRRIRPDDEPLMVRFHEGLSDRSVYQRYFHMMTLASRTAHARLTRICVADDDREVVLVAEGRDDDTRERVIMGVTRLERIDGGGEAEFAVVVADRYQGIGVGSALMRRLIEIARLAGVTRLRADILADNAPMRRMCARVGIPVGPSGDARFVVADLPLPPSPA